MIRTVDQDLLDRWIGKWVTYHGKRRQAELGQNGPYKVVDVRQDGTSIAFDAGIFGTQWCAVNSVEIVDAPAYEVVTPLFGDFLNPHASTLEALDAEIKRYQDKLNELRAARQVIAGL
jgi:hypothetical protein